MLEGNYQLKNDTALAERRSMLTLPHILPLVDYLETVRSELGSDYDTPMFDPCDGGVGAKALFLLEAPGPKAVGSDFISRNNPDPTAKNINRLLDESGFKRRETILWNIVPWYVGSNNKIRPVRKSDIKQALPYLKSLLELLQELQVIILVGKKAQKAYPDLSKLTDLPIIESYHPSNLSINSDPNRYSEILEEFKKAKRIIGRGEC